MRKVGIITLYDPENYGNRLQAYAMAKTLQNLDCEAVEVYRCNGLLSIIKGTIKTNSMLRFGMELVQSITVPEKGGVRNYRRVATFLNFVKRTRVKHIRSDDPSIDYFVCGSDQIWNPDLGGTPFFFANFAPKEKRIAYAASFGVSELQPNIASDYGKYLKDMAHISVREQAGAKLVQELAGRDVPVVLDPTMLLNREEWHAMAKKPKFPVKERFAVAYFLGWHSEEIDTYITKIAQEHDLQIISLDYMQKDRCWFGTGPAEFLWLIENASLVFTNSFHATVFSIIMNTPFVNFKRETRGNDMNSRITTLLNTVKLSDRVYGQLDDERLFEVDFCDSIKSLETEKQRSIEYLKTALDLS